MPYGFKRSPFLEAAIEFVFTETRTWDWTIPGIFYEEVKTDFPKKGQLNLLELELQPAQGIVQQKMKGGIARMQFSRNDESAMIQVGQNVISVNQKSPYPNWRNFKSTSLETLRKYRDVAGANAFKRVGLRYVSRILIPAKSFDLDEYFVNPPQIPVPEGTPLTSILQQVVVGFTEPRMGLRHVLATTESPDPGQSAFMLDLDIFAPENAVPTFDATPDWLEVAHDRLEASFLGSLTKKTREEVLGQEEY